jgi:hypothetical protein
MLEKSYAITSPRTRRRLPVIPKGVQLGVPDYFLEGWTAMCARRCGMPKAGPPSPCLFSCKSFIFRAPRTDMEPGTNDLICFYFSDGRFGVQYTETTSLLPPNYHSPCHRSLVCTPTFLPSDNLLSHRSPRLAVHPPSPSLDA